MVKPARYRMVLALLIGAVAMVGEFLPSYAAAAGREGACMHFAVLSISMGYANSAEKKMHFAQISGIRAAHLSRLFHLKISCYHPLQMGKEPGRFDPMGKRSKEFSLAEMEPLLRMILIRTSSSRGLKQLRAMHLDIVSIRPLASRAPARELDSDEYIVEAVVTKGQLAKLKAMGFEVSEIPEKN